MAQGMEGPFRSADVNLIRREEGQKSRAEVLIAAESAQAETIANNARLTAVLRGEEFFSTIQNISDPNKQISLAKAILKSVPFIIRFLPPHITEEDHQAAIIVGIALALKTSTEQMN